MKLLVCGGRFYNDREALFASLDATHSVRPITLIIHGGARGADTLAGEWGKSRGIPVQVFSAHWDRLGNKAGTIRNSEMLAEGAPDVVAVAEGGAGTSDMLTKAKKAGKEILFVGARDGTLQ